MATIIENGDSKNHGMNDKLYLLNSLSTDSDSTIQSELAAETSSCAPGSRAITPDLLVICIKCNDGTWIINR